MNNTKISVVWLRRDLRLEDHAALYHALKGEYPVLPVFIFDTNILNRLEDKADKRVQFIYGEITRLSDELCKHGSTLVVKYSTPLQAWKELLSEYTIEAVYANHDYEPYAIERDQAIASILRENGVSFHTYKDHVIFEKGEVVKDDGLPYPVFTPYSKKWRAKLNSFYSKSYPSNKYLANLYKTRAFAIPTITELGFIPLSFHFPQRVVSSDVIKHYTEQRDFPALNGTSKLGLHLRFGTLSIRMLLSYAMQRNQTFVNELIWRDFYQQILWHFPYVVKGAFRKEYDAIEWGNDEKKFEAWCNGQTGFPLVDAGMRELNATGYMHNRVRMVVASFLTKQLLIDYKWGETYFAQKLLDFDLAANNGGWQWAAGCGTDAAPYFRVFNPQLQMERFDPQMKYVKKWVPEYGTSSYATPIIDQKTAKEKVMLAYGKALKR